MKLCPCGHKHKKLRTSYEVLNFLEATPGFEPGIKVLQTHALPLGYVAKIFNCIFTIKGCLKSNLNTLFGADDEARTRYLHLGKVALYQMSYIRNYGASGRNRTIDTRIFSPLLYQLSYRGKKMATPNGIEPSTSSVTG